MPQQDAGTKHVAELVDAAKIGMLTTMTTDGRHLSRPMALQEVEFDGDLWFFADEGSDKVAQIRANPQVNVGFNDNKSWTSLAGSAELVKDKAKAEELWSPSLKAWLAAGTDTPGMVLIKVPANSAEYWETSSSKVVRLIGAARAVATGDRDKFPSDNAEVSL
ncbi:MAG: pyridoxamine 5'-phosphate oxidase family protein [Mycobacteriales bacterium]